MLIAASGLPAHFPRSRVVCTCVCRLQNGHGTNKEPVLLWEQGWLIARASGCRATSPGRWEVFEEALEVADLSTQSCSSLLVNWDVVTEDTVGAATSVTLSSCCARSSRVVDSGAKARTIQRSWGGVGETARGGKSCSLHLLCLPGAVAFA